MKAQQKKLSGCASNSLAHEDLGHFEEAHHWNIQAKFYNEKFPLVYESDNIWDSLYEEHGATLKHNIWDSLHEEQGATLKHKCGKRDSSIVPSLFFSHFFGPSIFDGLSFFIPHLGQCSNNDDHHTSIYLQLNDYNSILEQSMTLYECLGRCTGICNEPRVTCMKELWTVALPQILCQLHDHASNMTMMERVIVNGTVVSCMAIYLGMAMEMP